MNAWERFFWLWEVLFGITFAATTALVLLEGGTTTDKTVAILCLTGVGVTYLVRGRRLIKGPDYEYTPWLFVGVMMLFLAGASLASTTSSFILFLICPVLYMTLTTKTASILTTAAVLMGPAASIIRGGFDQPSLRILLPMTAILIVFSLLAGRYTSQIIDQSKARAALIEQLEASQAEVSRLSREAGMAAERERMAREIHDTLAQGFTSIVTLTQAIESEMDTDPKAARRHLELAARTARENLAEARAMVAAQVPSALAAASLEEALRRQVERLTEEAGIEAAIAIKGPLPSLPMATEVVVLRGAQEALSNIRKHSRATRVSLRLSAMDGGVRLGVTDDGIGFDPAEPTGGFGLAGMRTRANQVGGRVKVESGPGAGTTLELEVPA
ncbi:sensor histidine kinase [Amycolatopsis regifaucium]|uniref:Oxygen sensor histidine kinase NreB n=1 Tax=Amycolatopsis regifaucium TaxID=546365 RepID=A0A154MSJ1_9PSEU|nr:sensor histidine kinase [Amycolatopsis regifaucium]KZB87294.1 histidine kinase [Amycolatopsis regifaucium]OKA08128.1 two-component sensor histidine kinase [Amycolatopsis regifaucium]SFI40558.1 Signal transduction histidine kinase [Amycolatopsis regifaucium]